MWIWRRNKKGDHAYKMGQMLFLYKMKKDPSVIQAKMTKSKVCGHQQNLPTSEHIRYQGTFDTIKSQLVHCFQHLIWSSTATGCAQELQKNPYFLPQLSLGVGTPTPNVQTATLSKNEGVGGGNFLTGHHHLFFSCTVRLHLLTIQEQCNVLNGKTSPDS